MARRKKPRRTNYRRTARRYYNKAKSVASKAYTAYNLATKIARLVNVEHKYVEEYINQGVDWDGDIIDLNSIAGIGTGDNDNRIGDSVKSQFLDVHGHVNFNNTTNRLDVQVITVILFIDYQNNTGATGAVLESNRISTSIAPYAHKDKDLMYRTKYLWKRTFTLSEQKDVLRFHAKVKLHSHTQFEAGTSTINTNAIKMLVISNNDATNSTLNPRIECLSRYYYTDN